MRLALSLAFLFACGDNIHPEVDAGPNKPYPGDNGTHIPPVVYPTDPSPDVDAGPDDDCDDQDDTSCHWHHGHWHCDRNDHEHNGHWHHGHLEN